jgi:hypothetical protein
MSTESPALLAHIERHARRYFDDLGTGPLSVALVRSHRRTRSALHVVRITAGTSSRLVVAKASRQLRRAPASSEFNLGARPYLAPPVPADEIATLQFRAMQMIHERLERLGDPRLGGIRALDHVPKLNTVIMEHVSHPTLATRLRSQGRHIAWWPPSETIVGAVANAGAWLREYHALSDEWERPELGISRDEFIGSVREVTSYLAAATGDAKLFGTIGEAIERHARTELPLRLPAGLSHGDYAPRNIFASPEGQVLGFDALPRWRAPVYLDLGRFVVSLRSSGVQVLSAGRAHAPSQLDQFEAAFLVGYFGADEAPMATVRLYQFLVLLDRWASILARSRPTGLRWRIAMVVRQPLFRRQFRSEAARILRSFDRRAADLALGEVGS